MKFSPLNLLTNLALKRIGERKIKLCLCRSFSVGTLGTLFFSVDVIGIFVSSTENTKIHFETNLINKNNIDLINL